MPKKKQPAAARPAVKKRPAGARKAVPKTAPAQPRSPTKPSVRVRMYRQGLGDCFLLTFGPSSARPFQMLIDCGVILGTPDPVPKMRQVAQHIAQTVGKAGLDLLVATHEHWDHLSGFVQAADEFAAMTIRKTWLAWTEDPRNPTARKLRRERDAKLNRAVKALVELQNSSADLGVDGRRAADRLSAQVDQILSFFGIDAGHAASRSAASGGMGLAAAATAVRAGTTTAAMNWLHDLAPEYRSPADPPIELPEVPGVRFYVLGPPLDPDLLKKDLPSKSGQETYELAPAQEAFFAAVAAQESGSLDAFRPFSPGCALTVESARLDPFFQRHYFGENGPDSAALDWRRIDAQWLSSLSQFALKLDSDTNNASLAIAIELPDGRVLLFPGDAQVGSWESWSSLEWTVDRRKVTGPDLLCRTVLYKVGHHGSHNATLRARGLELMTSPDLVAMLPVDEQVAHDVKGWTRMPFAPLVQRLKEKTNNQILRSDADGSLKVDHAEQAPTNLVKSGTRHALYVDYFIEP